MDLPFLIYNPVIHYSGLYGAMPLPYPELLSAKVIRV